jgi:hypothetical protein
MSDAKVRTGEFASKKARYAHSAMIKMIKEDLAFA